MNGKGKAALGIHGKQIRPWAWAALVAILMLYVFSALRANPIATFGTSSDDALYFASAKALSTGQGYVLPSFPVRLRATRYPELYPLLLAGIWKLDSRFPRNVNLAVYVTLAFGCAVLVIVFLMLRQWPGMDDWQALAVVCLCGFTYHFLDLSSGIRTEIPFTAAMLGSVWLAERREWGNRAALAAGLLAGLSVGLRSLGAAAIAGIGLFMLTKRDFKRAVWFSLAAAPLTLLWLWPALAAVIHTATVHATSPGDPGWTQTLCYYTSYGCEWKMNVNSAAALKAVILTNLKQVIQQPGLYLLGPLAMRNTLWSLVAVMLVSAASYVGIVRYVRKSGWQPLVFVYIFYLLVVVPWPWTPERFLLTFLPLFFGGLWLEGKHLAALVVENFRPSHLLGERVMAGVLAASGLALAATAAVNYGHAIPSELANQTIKDEKQLAEERGAYDWIRDHTAPNARIIAYEDGLLSLYTGRRSVIPIMAHTQDFYQDDPSYAKYDATHLADVARHIGASYWLVTEGDFDLTDGIDRAVLRKRQAQLLRGAPVVYQSDDGAVRLFDVSCLTRPEGKGCSERTGTQRSGSDSVSSKPHRGGPFGLRARQLSKLRN